MDLQVAKRAADGFDKDGNVVIDGYQTEDEPRMPQFRLSEEELLALSAYLSTQKAKPLEPYAINPRVIAAWEKKPDLAAQGELRFRQMFCTTCHSLSVTRAGETKLIGGSIGPELTKVGSKVNRDWLVDWLRNPQGYLPNSKMPRYEWTDEDLYKVTQYISTTLSDSDLLSNVPQLGSPHDEEVQMGRRLFAEKGCGSCHAIEGVSPQKEFGPDLSSLGGKNVSQLEFGDSTIPRNLISYVQAKITNPSSVNTAARMPQYHLNADDLDSITTALLSMGGTPASSGMQKLICLVSNPSFIPPGHSESSTSATNVMHAINLMVTAGTLPLTFPMRAAERSANGLLSSSKAHRRCVRPWCCACPSSI